jgi:hypothetical protein
MNNTVTVELPVATDGSESTGGKLGFAIGTLLNLKRMIELNMTDHSSNQEGMRGLTPMFSKHELMATCQNAIDKLNTIKYPYAV